MENFFIQKEPLEKSTQEKNIQRLETLISHLTETLDSSIERPSYRILADGNEIENQQISVYYDSDEDKISFRFKLVDYEKKLENIVQRSKTILKTDKLPIVTGSFAKFNFKNLKKTLEEIDPKNYEEYDYSYNEIFADMGSFYSLDLEDCNVRFSSNERLEYIQHEKTGNSQCAVGLVEISFDLAGHSKNHRDLILKFESVMDNILDIHGVLEIPDSAETQAYKEERFKWFFKTESPPTDEISQRMTRKTITGGYKTFLIEGLSDEFKEKFGKFIFIHSLNVHPERPAEIIDSLIPVISDGLVSTSRRFRSGNFRQGLSSLCDIHSGGAEYVFTRLSTERTLEFPDGKVVLLLSPSLSDRTDWFSYDKDMYGSTDSYYFDERLSPNDLFLKENDVKKGYNEVMFRDSISPKSVIGMYCSMKIRSDLIEILKQRGIYNINNILIENFIVSEKYKVLDVLDSTDETKV
jgi:hypothetical protein